MPYAKLVEDKARAQEAAAKLGFGACDAGINDTLAFTVVAIQDHDDGYHIVVKK